MTKIRFTTNKPATFRSVRPAPLLMALAAGALLITNANAQEGDPNRGAALFSTCSACHEATSTKEKVGPGLKGLFGRNRLVNGQKPSEQAVRKILDAGGSKMPSFAGMPKRQKDDLIAYLMTL